MAEHNHHVHTINNNAESEHDHSHHLNPWLLGGLGAVGAVTLAPYILPLFDVGSFENAENIMHGIGGHSVVDAAGVPSSFGRGLAGSVASGISKIPLIGSILTSAAPVEIPLIGITLTTGVLATLGVTAAIGIGGVMLANKLEKQENADSKIHWSKIIRYTAMATTALIALPNILSGLSVGIASLAMAVGGYGAANSAILALQSTIGATAMAETAMAGNTANAIVGITVPHLISCGSGLLPAVLPFLFNKSKDSEKATEVSNHPKTKDDIQISARLDKPLRLGVKTKVNLKLTHSNGKPVELDELAVVHTEKLHMLIADKSLKDYQHIHPQPTGKVGEMEFSFTPQITNDYSAWADFRTAQDGVDHQIKLNLPTLVTRNITPSIRINNSVEKAGLHFEWKSGMLKEGRGSMVEVTVTDTNGRPVNDLQPVMGAFAHLVGFSADGGQMIHTHPIGREIIDGNERGGNKLRFHIHPESDGMFQFHLQVRRDGQDIYVPFGQMVAAEVGASEKLYTERYISHPKQQMNGMA